MSDPTDPSQQPEERWDWSGQGNQPASGRHAHPGEPNPFQPPPAAQSPYQPDPQYGPPQYQQPQNQPPQYQQPQCQPPQYQQPQYQQPQYQQPQYGQPQYQPPQYGQPQYQQPQYGQPNAYLSDPGQPPDLLTSPPRRGRGKAVVGGVVAVVVIAGAAVSYVALGDKSSKAGAATPQKAVTSIVTALTKSDVLGLLDDLPPAERDSLRDSFVSEVSQLKRLKVLNSTADAGKVAGVQASATGLTYLPNDIVINDHVRIVQLTGGTITVNSDQSKIPYTQDFIKAAFPNGAPSAKSSDTVNIADEIAKGDGKPVRIAVQKVDGKWYPSLMYTIVDNAAHESGASVPTAADAIPADGENSAENAVRQFISAASTSNVTELISLLDPNEDAALHDYGKTLGTSKVTSGERLFALGNVELTSTPITGGTRVSLKSISFRADDEQVKVSIDGECVTVDSDGDSQRLCALATIEKYAGSELHLTAAQKTAITDLIAALPKIGVVSTKVGGKFYISPIRTYADIGTAVLSNLKGDDLLTLIEFARSR